MSKLGPYVSRRPLLFFCLLSFAIAWPAFAASVGGVPPSSQLLLLIAGSLAPAISAFILASLTHDRVSLRQRTTMWRVGVSWYLISIILPVASWLVSALAVSLLAAPLELAPAMIISFPIIYATNFLEEVGWRGFALPTLLRRRPALTSSLVLGLLWALFHAPLYWQRPVEGVLFLAPIIPISIVLTWLFITTGGSVPLCALFHAVFNTCALILLSGGPVQPLLLAETIALLVTAGFLAIRYGHSLSGRVLTGRESSSAA